MFTFRQVETDSAALSAYERLFKARFPGTAHLDRTYLQRLYTQNPGGDVFGFDALNGDVLAAHYACTPVQLVLRGQQVRALLSPNTATHPSYQGKGLFTHLATRISDRATEQDFQAIYGIANANSTPRLVCKRGFTLVKTVAVGTQVPGVVATGLRGGEAGQSAHHWNRYRRVRH